MMKNRNMMIAAIVGAVLLLGGGFFLWVNSGKAPEKKEMEQTLQKEEIKTIDPSQLGLTLTARGDKKAVNLEIANLTGLKSIEYELSYIAKGDIPRGVIGSIEIKPTDKKVARELLLGTCSKNVCKYDEGVTEATLIVKVTKTDDSVLQSEKKISL